MKPIARISGNTVTFHSRLVPGISSIYAWIKYPQDVKMCYDNFIAAERRYLEKGPRAICNDFDFEYLHGKLKKKFVVNVSVRGLTQAGLRTYSMPSRRKDLENHKDTAYRIVVRLKPGALKKIKAEIKDKRDADILKTRAKYLTFVGQTEHNLLHNWVA